MCARSISETRPGCELEPGPNSIGTAFSTLFFSGSDLGLYTFQGTTETSSWYFKPGWELSVFSFGQIRWCHSSEKLSHSLFYGK